MKIIVRTCPGREEQADYLRRHLPPEAEIIKDTGADAMKHFLRALRAAGGDGVLHLEDDIILTKGFADKARLIVSRLPNSFIQFFSMRKDDIAIGSRWMPGSTFSMNQCHYIPPGANEQLADYYEEWPRREEHPTGYDLMMADWLKAHKIRYWLHVPSLVDHRAGKSLINPRRSSGRQSLTFKDPIEDEFMDWKWDQPLREGMMTNPVIHMERLDLDAHGIQIPTDEDLETVFKTAGYRLQTWNRSTGDDGKVILENDPHWLAVRKGTPLHIDPKYPRYSHQLKIRVDSGTFVRGQDKVELKLTRGTFYVLDTHSPHQVFHKEDNAGWNVTASIDSKVVMDPDATIKRLIDYAKNTSILEGV